MIHKINDFYITIYQLGYKISKRDHFGLHLTIEQLCLNVLELTITASLQVKTEKLTPLKTARLKLEVLKHLIRSANELHIIETKIYLQLETKLQELSKMTNGWIKYLNL